MRLQRSDSPSKPLSLAHLLSPPRSPIPLSLSRTLLKVNPFYDWHHDLPAIVLSVALPGVSALLLHARSTWTAQQLSWASVAFSTFLILVAFGEPSDLMKPPPSVYFHLFELLLLPPPAFSIFLLSPSAYNIPTGDPDAVPLLYISYLCVAMWFAVSFALRGQAWALALAAPAYLVINAIGPTTRSDEWPTYLLHAFIIGQLMIMAIRQVYISEHLWKHHLITRSALMAEGALQEDLLRLLLPPSVLAANRAAGGRGSRFADSYPEVSILFVEVTGLDVLSAQMPPLELLALLNDVFSTLDELVKKNPGATKIETVAGKFPASSHREPRPLP